MRNVSRYAYLNARVRAMIGRLLSADKWQDLYSSPDIQSMMKKLDDTPYRDWTVDKSPEEFVRSLDTKIYEESLNTEKKIKKHLKEIPAEIIGLLTEEYDIEQIKYGLRAWRAKVPFEIPSEKILSNMYKIDWEIFNNNDATLEDIIISLINSPYGRALSSVREIFNKNQSIFYLETALEKDLFNRIWLLIDEMTGRDREVVKKLFGIHVDILNVKNLIRCKLYFQIPPDHLIYTIYPNGTYLDYKKCFDSYNTTEKRDFFERIAVKPFKNLTSLLKEGDIKQSALLLNVLLQQVLYKEILKNLGGYPFTLGVPLGYIILHRWELKQIHSLAWSLLLGNKENFMESWIINPLSQK